ncbi:MAG: hypothetical protein PHO71_24090 [Bacteroides sp.]|nr:hypothetical protein [Bacteroides sp.]
MFLFKITVTITYLRTHPDEIVLLHKHIDQTFQCFVKPLGYNIAWGASKLRVPSQSMDQAVTESDIFVVERKFLQYKNVLSSVKIFSGIIELLQSQGYVNIS